jgi:hypothetical protein
MESKKSIKTDYLQSQTKAENSRKSRTPRNPKSPRILSPVPDFRGFFKDSEFVEFKH